MPSRGLLLWNTRTVVDIHSLTSRDWATDATPHAKPRERGARLPMGHRERSRPRPADPAARGFGPDCWGEHRARPLAAGAYAATSVAAVAAVVDHGSVVAAAVVPLRLVLVMVAVAKRSEGPISSTSSSMTVRLSPSRVS